MSPENLYLQRIGIFRYSLTPGCRWFRKTPISTLQVTTPTDQTSHTPVHTRLPLRCCTRRCTYRYNSRQRPPAAVVIPARALRRAPPHLESDR